MSDNFQIKKNNFLPILDTDIYRSGLFAKWICFVNGGSICHYAMTHNVNLNSGLLKQVFTTAKRANQGEISGFKFRLQNRTVFLNERDLNIALHFPMENFEDYPTNEELLGFFTWIQCSLDENNMIPRVIYQNHLPKE